MNYISYEQTKELINQVKTQKGEKGDKGDDGTTGITVNTDGKVVVTGTDKELATCEYIDSKIGDIETILSKL